MPTINASQIYNKVKSFSKSEEGKKMMADKIEQYKKDGVRRTCAGDPILTQDEMHNIAHELIQDLQQMASVLEMSGVLPKSVADHFDYLSADIAIDHKNGSCEIGIYFDDDLHRDSLLAYGRNGSYSHRTGSGIDNIIALFEFGYDTWGAVYGYWENARIDTWSLSSRPALGFMQAEIDRFNARYRKSVCHAELMW